MVAKQPPMSEYYRKRAPVYDRVYQYPERQDDLRFLETYIPDRFNQLDILEIAAGTGYWTQFISHKAHSILATDILEEPLQFVKQRELGCPVEIRIQDAFSIAQIGDRFAGIFSALFLSHIPRQQLTNIFEQIRLCAAPGCKVILLDNSAAQCERLPIAFTDEHGNSYQDRTLDDGSVHRVLKNFPTGEELKPYIDPYCANQKFTQLDHFWMLEYEIDNPAG